MLPALLATRVAFAEEPEPVAPDVTGLRDRAREAARAMPGCFDMAGTGSDAWEVTLFGRGEHRWQLAGRLKEGRWTPLTAVVAADSPDKPDANTHRGSLFGTEATERSDAGKESFLAALEDEVGVEYVEREGAGWRLVHTLRGGEGLRNTLSIGFDAAMQARRWAIHIVDPVVLETRRGRKAKIVWMELAMETDDRGAPAHERIDGVFAQWPFRAEVHARTDWTARPCE